MDAPSSLLPRIGCAALAAAFTAGLTVPARADDAIANPGIGVARVSFLSGDVAVGRGDANETTAAVINAPVLGADYLTTGDGSRAELQIGGASAMQLGEDVQLRLVHLDDGRREFQLAQGTIELSLLRDAAGHPQIDTPSITVRPLERGRYRVTVTPDGETDLTVRSGRAVVSVPGGDQVVTGGNTLVADGPADDPSIQYVAPVAWDAFDAFAANRDARLSQALAGDGYYGSIDGYSDLASYGSWQNVAPYGRVWVPAEPAGWAPYHDGRWVWEDDYGWTWVANEPWGWAPYHYGRWFYNAGYGWCWTPPPPAPVAPAWAPALVGFFSLGGASGLAFSIGWVPLAPYDSFRPWWGGPTVVNNVTNITYVTNVTNVYGNANAPGAAVAVSQQRFEQGNFRHPIVLAPAQVRSIRPARVVPIVPSTANLRFSQRVVPHPLVARAAFVQRSFAGHPVAVRRATFAAQQARVVTATHAELAHPSFVNRSAVNASAHPALVTPPPPRAVPSGVTAEQRRQPTPSPWQRFATARGTNPPPAPRNGSYVALPPAGHGTPLAPPAPRATNGGPAFHPVPNEGPAYHRDANLRPLPPHAGAVPVRPEISRPKAVAPKKPVKPTPAPHETKRAG